MYLYVDASYMANSAANGLPPEQLRYGPPAIALDIVAKIAQYIRTYNATRTYFCLDPRAVAGVSMSAPPTRLTEKQSWLWTPSVSWPTIWPLRPCRTSCRSLWT